MQDKKDKRMTIAEAVKSFVNDGCSVAFSGIASREPMAACYEIIRQGRKDLTFITDSQADAAELLIAGGCLRKMEFAYVWIGVIGMGYNFRRAVEKGIPNHLELEEYSNLGMSARFMAGATGLPFMPTKSLLGSDIITNNPRIKVMDDPYGSGPVALVPAAEPDVAFIHVHRADRTGNAQIWGMLMNDDILARAAKNTVLLCEEIIPTSEIRKLPNMTAIPSYCVSAVVEVPFACHPLSIAGCYWMDIPFRRAMVAAAKTREGMEAWMDEWISGVPDHEAYREKVGRERLAKLQKLEHDNYRIPQFKTEE
ncbi:MAG: CoA transferase subunit A [Syntrophales bacterium]|nr:CoA transferase subunit A [Syntrophales bacterium]